MTNVLQGSTSAENTGITVQGLVEKLEKEQQIMKETLLELEQRFGSVLCLHRLEVPNEVKEQDKSIAPLVDQLKSILEKTKSNISFIISMKDRCYL